MSRSKANRGVVVVTNNKLVYNVYKIASLVTIVTVVVVVVVVIIVIGRGVIGIRCLNTYSYSSLPSGLKGLGPRRFAPLGLLVLFIRDGRAKLLDFSLVSNVLLFYHGEFA